MAHAIDATTGKNAIAYLGETPWHGLGQPLTGTETPEQILEAAALDWSVSLRPAVYAAADGTTRSTKHQVIVRDDTEAALGMAGKIYKPIQNADVVRFFSEYAETGELTIETAGSLHGGKMIWALAKMNLGYELPGNDIVNGYILLANPHMYGKAATAKFTAVRVVCHNTLTSALGSKDSGFKINHTRLFDEKRREQVKQQLGIAREQLDRAKAISELLASLTLSKDDSFAIAAEVMPERASLRVLELFDGSGIGADLASAKGTAWGLLNATTQYLDWERGRSPDTRLFHSWFGGGQDTKIEMIREIAAQSGSEDLDRLVRELSFSA